MSKMQRTKGSAFERDIVNDLKTKGFAAARNLDQTRDGGGDINLPTYLFECKRYAKIRVYEWLDQATKAAKEHQMPVVVARGDNRKAIAILYWDDFLGMIDNAETLTKPYDPMVAPDKAEGSI